MSDIIDYLIKNKDNIHLSRSIHQCAQNNDGMFVLDSRNAALHLSRRGGMFEIGRFFSVQPAVAVVWAYGDIAYYPIGNSDAFSFDFSGCVMAAFRTTQWYAVHIQIEDHDCKEAWIRYMAANPKIEDLVMFRPNVEEADSLSARLPKVNNKPPNIYIWGLISTRRVCYTLYLTDNSKAEQNFSLAGIIRHTTGYKRDYYDQLLVIRKKSILDTVWKEFWKERYLSQKWIYDRSDPSRVR